MGELRSPFQREPWFQFPTVRFGLPPSRRFSAEGSGPMMLFNLVLKKAVNFRTPWLTCRGGGVDENRTVTGISEQGFQGIEGLADLVISAHVHSKRKRGCRSAVYQTQVTGEWDLLISLDCFSSARVFSAFARGL